jgi:hypothetical protein
VLLYAERLFGRVPRAAVVTIGGAAFDHGTELSSEALQAVPEAARKIRSLAGRWAPTAELRARRRLSSRPIICSSRR